MWICGTDSDQQHNIKINDPKQTQKQAPIGDIDMRYFWWSPQDTRPMVKNKSYFEMLTP